MERKKQRKLSLYSIETSFKSCSRRLQWINSNEEYAYFHPSPMETTPLEIERMLLKIEKLSYSITSFVQTTLREREREKKDRNMDATYFAKRTKLVSTSEVDIEGRGCCCALLHASKVYRACIYERLWSFQFERTREPATIKFPSKV